MKIIHWEYNEELIGQDNSAKPELRMGLTYDNDTDEKTGFYLLWVYLLQKGHEVFIHMVVQDTYRTIGKLRLTFDEFSLLLVNSLFKFKQVLEERTDLLGLEVVFPEFSVDEGELKVFLDSIYQ